MADLSQELAALGLVLGLVGGTFRHTDIPNGPNGVHDFEIDTGVRTIALEVTSTTVEEVRKMWDAVGKQSWQCTKATCSWSISVQAAGPGIQGTQIKRLRNEIEEHLVVLELAGVSYFGEPHPMPQDPAIATAISALQQLGVRSGGFIGPPPHRDIAPQILVGSAGPAGVSDPEYINDAVERAIQDNLVKLLKTSTDERHLFVWVDSTDLRCFAPLSFGLVPDNRPSLNEGIDKVWVAAAMTGPTVPTSVLWSVMTSGPWVSETIRYRDVTKDL